MGLGRLPTPTPLPDNVLTLDPSPYVGEGFSVPPDTRGPGTRDQRPITS